MEVDLLQCPFCGGPAGMGTIRYSSETIREQHWGQDTFWKVNCTICGSNNLGLVGHDSPELAARHWNKRYQPAAHTEVNMTHHDKHDGGKQYIEAINAWRASKLPGWWSTFQALSDNQREYLATTYPMVFGVISAAHLTAGQIGQYYAPTLGWSHEDEAVVNAAIQPTLAGEPKRRDFPH